MVARYGVYSDLGAVFENKWVRHVLNFLHRAFVILSVAEILSMDLSSQKVFSGADSHLRFTQLA